MSAPIREFRKMAIPVDKKFSIYVRFLPHQEGPDEAARGVQTAGTGMEAEEESVCARKFLLLMFIMLVLVRINHRKLMLSVHFDQSLKIK